MKNIIYYYSLFVFLAVHSSLFAIPGDDLKKWLPSKLHSPATLKKLADEMNAESQTRIPKDPSSTNKDYGFDFPRVSPVLETALVEIKTRYETTGSHPVVLDAGAGLGSATVKMWLAGGQVSALEFNKVAAVQFPTKLRKTMACLDQPLENPVPKFHLHNVMNFESPAYAQEYDVTYSGNLMHFLSPEHAESYVKQLFKVTKPGGLAVAEANAPSYFPCIIDLWKKNREQGNPFPGNIVKDMDTLRIVDYDGDKQKLVNELEEVANFWRDSRGVERFSEEQHQGVLEYLSKSKREQLTVMMDTVAAHSPKENDPLYPGTVRAGSYSSPQESEEWKKFIISTDVGSYISKETHLAFHYFDPETLSRLFSDAGFNVSAAYYLSGENEKILPQAMTDQQLDDKAYNSVVEAYKPAT